MQILFAKIIHNERRENKLWLMQSKHSLIEKLLNNKI